MAGHKSERMAEDIKREVSFLIRAFKDPRVDCQNLSVVRVDVLGDCSFAKVYVSSLKGMNDSKLAAKALTGASGYVKRAISNKLRLKKSPEIRFIADDSIEYGSHLDEIFSKMHEGESMFI